MTRDEVTLTLGALRFVVYGTPAPQGSKRVVRGRLIDANADKLRPYRAMVAGAAADALAAQGAPVNDEGALVDHEPARGPLAVSIRFCLPRPRGHYGTGRNEGRLKASAPSWPATKPDVDKLERAVLDALTGLVWVDDSQVVVLAADKVYTRTPMTLVTVEPAPPSPTT